MTRKAGAPRAAGHRGGRGLVEIARETPQKPGQEPGRPASAGPWWRDSFAAIDLGTNNCRLLVARPTAGGFRVIDAFSRIVRLGEGLSASGELSEAAMARTLAALKICANKMRRRRVARHRAVATEACRRAWGLAVRGGRPVLGSM